MGACCNQNTQQKDQSEFAMIVPKYDLKPDDQSKETKIAIAKYFPGALKGRLVEEIVYQKLESLGFTDVNTLFADCSCPDEINHNDPGEDITSLFMHRWGEIFPLSGIGGLPFAGKTGWAAFSSHTPKDGNIMILFAPHVGVDCDGNVGKVHRQGIEATTTACGAAVGAYNAVKGDKSLGDFRNGYHDHQMDCIKHLLIDHVDSIKG